MLLICSRPLDFKYTCTATKWHNFMISMIIVKLIRTFRKYLIKHLTTTIYIHTLYSCMHEYIPGVKDFSKQNTKIAEDESWSVEEPSLCYSGVNSD